MTRWPALTAVVVVLLATPLGAQTGPGPRRLTLEEALGLARPASEAVGLARAGLQRAQGEVRRARSELFPQVSGSASYNRLLKSQFEGFAGDGGEAPAEPAGPSSCDAFVPVPGDPVAQRLDSLERSVKCLSTLDPFGNLGNLPFGRANTWNLGLSASQTVFAGGRLLGSVAAAEAGRRSAEIALTAAEAQLVLEVVEAYSGAALADRMVAIARAALDQADSTLAQTALRREVGTVPEFDLLRATVARDNLRPQWIEAQAAREVAHLRLQQVLNLPMDQPLDLVTELSDSGFAATPTVASLLARTPDTAADRRAGVRQAQEALTASDALLRVARGDALPAVAITSQYGRVAYPSSALPNWGEFYTNWNVSVSLQVPLFTGGRLRAGREVARAGREEAALRLRQSSEGAALDARSARATLDAALATSAASQGTVAQAGRAYEIAEVRFREGLSTQTELLDARLALQQAQANHATAARNLVVARVRLALLADLPLAASSASPAATQATSTSSMRPALPAASSPTGPGFP